MDVFLFGLLRTIRAVLPHMRDQRSGKIINMSSSAATLALPFVGFYSAGKYAMAGLSESLRREVMGFNIWVSYLEASAFRTNADDEVIVAADRIEITARCATTPSTISSKRFAVAKTQKWLPKQSRK